MVHSVQIRNGEAVETTPGSLNAAMNAPHGTTNAQPAVKVMDSSEQRGRVTIGPNGEMEFTQHGPVRVQTGETNSTDPLELGRDGVWGNRIPRSELKPNSIVKIGGVEGDLAGFERLGLVEKGADGLYRLAEHKAQSQQQQTQAEPMTRISDAGESFITASAERLGPTTMNATLLSMIEGRGLVEMDGHLVPKNIGELASRLGKEPSQVAHNLGRLRDEFTAVAQRGLGMDEQTWANFVETTWERHPNEMREATVKFVDNGQLGPLRALAAKYTASGAAYDDDSLLGAELPEGARVWRNPDTQQIMLSYRGRTNTLRGLIASGEARVSRRK